MEAASEPEPEPVFDGPRIPIEAGTWRIIVPDIGLEAVIIDTGLEPDGTMEAPAGPDEVGWFRYGSPPGSSGNALMGGHVDWTDRTTGRPRGAVFFRLRQLQAGSLVVFSDGAQDYVYEVSEKRRYRWDDPASVDVLQPTTDSRLTLITCGGTFNSATRSYDMRDVIIAHRVA
jgi:sortase (surface protein transpeptidase)